MPRFIGPFHRSPSALVPRHALNKLCKSIGGSCGVEIWNLDAAGWAAKGTVQLGYRLPSHSTNDGHQSNAVPQLHTTAPSCRLQTVNAELRSDGAQMKELPANIRLVCVTAPPVKWRRCFEGVSGLRPAGLLLRSSARRCDTTCRSLLDGLASCVVKAGSSGNCPM